jgi:alkylhydroperoxidase family enzyme
MVTGYVEQVAQYVREADIDEVERWIESLPLGEDERAALWLYAWALRGA